MIHSMEEFRVILKSARRVGTPLVAVRTAGSSKHNYPLKSHT